MKKIARRLLEVTKASDMTDILEALEDQHDIMWRAVGDIDNNFGIINMAKDPAAGVVERITNAIDANLERRWIEEAEPTHISSPRKAVEEWWGIRGGHLNTIEKVPSIPGKPAAQTTVTLQDSDREDLPSVEIRDFGIGVASADFSESILGLNKNRKLRKHFLAGAFGQGGSTALSHSEYTVIASRPTDSDGEPNQIAITVVRFNPGNPLTDKHGRYEYAVSKEDQYPLTFTDRDDEFVAGTLVRHIAMKISKYAAVLTAQTGSLYWLSHNYLFDPVLPFTIQDERNGEKTKRVVAGNNRLLTHSENREYNRSATRTFNGGSVVITWWVISAEGENARKRITQYVHASQPIVITYNGQRQGTFPNTIIKNDLKLPYLERFIIVQVDCDLLDNDSRRELFTSTRESLKDTPFGDQLRQLVIETLADDENLRRFDNERKQRYIREIDSDSIDKIRRRLSKRVEQQTKGSGSTPGNRDTLPTPPPPPPPLHRFHSWTHLPLFEFLQVPRSRFKLEKLLLLDSKLMRSLIISATTKLLLLQSPRHLSVPIQVW